MPERLFTPDGHEGCASSEVPPMQMGLEGLMEDNTRRTSDLHTLLVSFPPGFTRNTILALDLPELGLATYALNVDSNLPDLGLTPVEHQSLLDALLPRAEVLVGGKDRAEFILQYPGITIDQDFSKVRPLPDSWREAFEHATILGPQMGAVIGIKGCRRIFEDIAAGRGNWDDVVFGYLTKEQIDRQKRIVAQLHKAFRSEPAMPVGYDHPSLLHAIPDARFGHLSRVSSTASVSFGYDLANWAELSTGIRLPQAPPLSGEWENTTIGAATADRLNALFGDPRLKPYVDAFIALYRAADEALDSKEGQVLMRACRRRLITKGSQTSSSGSNPVKDLMALVRKSVERCADSIRAAGAVWLPKNLEDTFMFRIDDEE